MAQAEGAPRRVSPPREGAGGSWARTIAPMTRAVPPGDQPAPAEGSICLSEDDLLSLDEAVSRDPAYNERRLVLRRKLAGLGKNFCALRRKPKLGLDSRTSLHNPHAFNGQRVRRIWAYCTRGKAEKGRLRKVVGADLARDLDAAFRNAYFCLAVEAEAVEVAIRIHSDAWFDGANLARRVKADGPEPLTAILNDLDGFQLSLADWKGEWRCGDLGPSRIEEFFGYFEPGTHSLALARRWPAPRSQSAVRAALCQPEAMAQLGEEMERLVPFYRYAAWSKESDFLFG